MSEDDAVIFHNVRDAVGGERIDLLGDGKWIGTVTDRIYQVPNDPLGPFFRDVVWITPPFYGMKRSGFKVYQNRQEYKAHQREQLNGTQKERAS